MQMSLTTKSSSSLHYWMLFYTDYIILSDELANLSHSKVGKFVRHTDIL